MGLFSKFKTGLAKTHAKLTHELKRIVTRSPKLTAESLEEIEHAAQRIDNVEAEEHPATAHMFIINPLHGGGLSTLFSSHPSLKSRIARLEASPPL